MYRIRRRPSPLSVTNPPPSRTTRALVLRTLAVALILIVTGRGPHEKRMTPPARTAAITAADVQPAEVPCPTTWSGCDVSTGPPAAGTGTERTPFATAAEPADAVATAINAVAPRHPIALDTSRRIQAGYWALLEAVRRHAAPEHGGVQRGRSRREVLFAEATFLEQDRDVVAHAGQQRLRLLRCELGVDPRLGSRKRTGHATQ